MSAVPEDILSRITATGNGSRALKLYMEACVRCGACSLACQVYQGEPTAWHNPVLRSDLIRSVYKRSRTFTGRGLRRLTGPRGRRDAKIEEWVDRFYSCTGCRRCATYCPMGIDNSVIMREARAIIDRASLSPERMKRAIRLSLDVGNTDGGSPAALRAAIAFLEEEMRDEHGTDIRIPVDVTGAEYFYLPPSGDVFVKPEATMGLAKIFHVLGMADKWTMSSRCFDVANYAFFSGNDDAMKETNRRQVQEAIRLKCKTLLMGECGHGYRIMKKMAEADSWWGELPFQIVSTLEFTARLIRQGALELDKSQNPRPVTYHDPCNLARSCGIIEEPRVILAATCADFREMVPNSHENWCCGGGGGLSSMDSLLDFRMNISGRKKMEQIRATRAGYVATACANCKRQLSQLVEYHRLNAVVGGVHDLLSNALLIDGKAGVRRV